MKQQIGIFRRISEAALALEWIEECIGKTKWWVHIQSSMEDEFRLIAPTPPTQFNEDVLDCALQYRRKDNVRQIILLSDDVNLKIKSMAKVFHYPFMGRNYLQPLNPWQTSAFGLI